MGMKSIKEKILGGIYLDDEESMNFCEKYGFRLEDLETDIDEMMTKSYWCYSVKELAYTICDKIYEILNNDNVDYYIEYKFIEKNKVHKISFGYKDLVFIFDIKWIGNSLSIVGWDLINGDDYEQQYKGFEEIDCAIDDDEEE